MESTKLPKKSGHQKAQNRPLDEAAPPIFPAQTRPRVGPERGQRGGRGRRQQRTNLAARAQIAAHVHHPDVGYAQLVPRVPHLCVRADAAPDVRYVDVFFYADCHAI